MVKREKKRKLGGSVLLTVVCVMSLLIIFLFGTLALATAANNRAHVNYSTAQTDVTSRTVVDAAIKAMEANTDFGNAVSTLNVGDMNLLSVNVQLGDGTEGRYGHIQPVSIRPVGTKKFYDTDKKEWVDGDIIEFMSTVSMAGVESSTAAYIVKQPPDTSDGSGGSGAGLVTTEGTASFDCQTSVYGGTYINLPEKEKAEKFDYRYSYIKNDVEKNEKRDYSDWGKDETTGEYIDQTLYRHFAPSDSADATTFKLSNNFENSTIESGVYVVNNMEFQKGKVLFQEKGKGITVWGDLKFGGNAKGSSLQYINNVSADKIKFNEIPYIYVDGKIFGENIALGNSGDSTEPLNIFCGSIEADFSGAAEKEIRINGDLYLMNPYETSTLKTKNSTALYKWTGSVINHTGTEEPHAKSNIYSKGNLELSNMTIDGDVRVEGDCTIGSGVTINGDLVVGGKLKIESGAKLNLGTDSQIYCDASIAEGLNDGVVQESKYVEVPTILHSAADLPDAEKVENKHRYYLEYKAQPTGDDPTKCYGLLGEPESYFTNEVVYYYKWKENFDPETLFGTNDYAIYGNPDTFTAKGLNIADYIEPGYTNDAWNDRRPANPVDGSVDYYYVKTAWDETAGGYVTKSEPTDKASYYVDQNTHEIVEDFRTVPNMDGTDKGVDKTMADYVNWNPSYGYTKDSESVWYSKETGNIVSVSEATPGALVTYPVESFGDIYPEYAERDVIIGEKTLPDVNKSETQIVKKMHEVLEKVNPYKYKAMPDPFKDAMTTAVKYTSVKDILEDTRHYTDDARITIGENHNIVGTYTQKELDASYFVGDDINNSLEDGYPCSSASPEQNGGPIIHDSCIINIPTVANGDVGAIVIDPQGSEIYIVIEQLGLNSGVDIIVNDSNPGSVVNFYIKEKLDLSGSNLVTTNYIKALNDNAGGFIGYGSSGCDFNLEDLGKPRVNIYGGLNSEFHSYNTRVVTANIVSPYLKVNFDGEAGSERNVKYDNAVIPGEQCKQLVIGCLNAQDVTVPNVMSVLYVDDAGGTPPKTGGDPDHAFNYRVLYYDEY